MSPTRRNARRWQTIGTQLAATALAGAAICGAVSANPVPGWLPSGVVPESILDGIVWQGLEIRLASLQIPSSVERFLESLSPVLPEGALLSMTDGIATVQWEQGDESILLHVAAINETSATGTLSRLRQSAGDTPENGGRLNRGVAADTFARDSHCGDFVAALLHADSSAEPIFDMRNAGPPKARSNVPGTIVRMRAFLAYPGVDATVAGLTRQMPRANWILRTQNSVHKPKRIVSLESLCGSRHMRTDITPLNGRTMVMTTETELQ